MKLFFIRLMLISILFLIINYILHWAGALFIAFVFEYVLEPLITSKI